VTVHTVRGTENHHIELVGPERFKLQLPYRKAAFTVHGILATVIDGTLRSVLLYTRSRGDLITYTDPVQPPYPAEVVALLERHGIKP
jgi:hypothetical protein